MTERYLPPSDFLNALIEDEASVVGGEHAEANLAVLIRLMVDEDPVNRDWATLLLAQQDLDTTTVREALLKAAEDENECVRAEAILGLAQRDKTLALPFVQRELRREKATVTLFEAAELVADPSLVDDLRDFASPSDNALVDEAVSSALAACQPAEQR